MWAGLVEGVRVDSFIKGDASEMGDRLKAWLVCGFLAALLMSVMPQSLRAQTQSGADSYDPNRVTSPLAPALPQGTRPYQQDDTPDDNAAPGIAPAIPSDDPSTEAEEDDPLNPTPKTGQRGVVEDGDPNYVAAETSMARDGVIDGVEPAAPEDGADPSVVDMRDPDDVALFENPPSPPDPLLFQIEDLDPVRDNRTTRRLFTQEPYDPVGIQIGSFVLFPEVVVGGSYYSNVFRSPSAKDDIAADLQPAARLVSNWGTHALEFRATGSLSSYSKYSTEDDRAYLLESRGRLDITRRANIQALISREQSLESRSALDASSAGTRAKLITDRAEVAYNQKFNRLSLQFRGSVADYAYGDTENSGVVTNNSDRDYTVYEETSRATWEFKPTLSTFAEVAVNQREYGEAATSDLINRSSNGQRYRVGVSFGNTGQILRGEVSLGYGIQTPDDSRLHSVDGLIVDANATWRVSALTSVLFNARSDVSETTTTNVGGAFYRNGSIDVRHSFLPYLIGTAGIGIGNQSSEDGIINETELRETVGLEYYADRETILFGKYVHSNLNAVGVTSDYASDEVHFGVRLRR